MQIIKMGCGIFVALAAPVVVWAQPMSTPIVDPPRQQMQTVVPNLEVGAYLMNVTGKTFAGDSFLDVAVTDNGTPVADGTTVSLSAVAVDFPTDIGASKRTAAFRMSKASRRALRTAAGSINARLHRAPSAERFSPQKMRAGRNASSGNLQRQRGIERGPVVAAHPPDFPLRHRVKLGRVLVVLLPHRTPVVDREPTGGCIGLLVPIEHSGRGAIVGTAALGDDSLLLLGGSGEGERYHEACQQ